MNVPAERKTIVLVGAGHTHLHVVAMWEKCALPNVELVLVSAFDQATYSGMLPGTLAGLYKPDEMTIGLRPLTNKCGVQLIVSAAVGLDPVRKVVQLEDGSEVSFDVVSVGIGSVPANAEFYENLPAGLSIKPMPTFLSRLQTRLAELSSKDRSLNVAIVGAGAAGFEISLCLEAFLRNEKLDAKLRLIDSHEQILSGYSPKTIKRATEVLKHRGIELLLNRKVVDSQETENGLELNCSDGSNTPIDLAICTTGAVPAPVFENFDLPKDERGFLAVRPTLQTTADFPVFAVGDSAGFLDQRVPKAGVYAVREGPVLWENLQRFLEGRSLEPFQSQTGFLSLLALGEGTALLEFHRFSAQGAWVWKLKNWIDRRFMKRFQSD